MPEASDHVAERPFVSFALPDDEPDAFGHPLLVVLLGNDRDANASASLWTGATDSGWVVVIPRPRGNAAPGGSAWDDPARAAADIGAYIETAKRMTTIDVGRIVLAGFATGGALAIALPLAGRIRVRGVVSVAPWVPDVAAYAPLVEAGAGRMLRSYLVIGDRDPNAAGARALADLFVDKGMRTRLDEREDLGHGYPSDMSETLVRALEFVTAP